jgi:hypothetical protein
MLRTFKILEFLIPFTMSFIYSLYLFVWLRNYCLEHEIEFYIGGKKDEKAAQEFLSN